MLGGRRLPERADDSRRLLHCGEALATHVADQDPGIALQAAVVQVAADHGVLGRGQVPGRHPQPIGPGRQARQDGPLRGLGDRGDPRQLLLPSDADVGDQHGSRAHQHDIDQAYPLLWLRPHAVQPPRPHHERHGGGSEQCSGSPRHDCAHDHRRQREERVGRDALWGSQVDCYPEDQPQRCRVGYERRRTLYRHSSSIVRQPSGGRRQAATTSRPPRARTTPVPGRSSLPCRGWRVHPHTRHRSLTAVRSPRSACWD